MDTKQKYTFINKWSFDQMMSFCNVFTTKMQIIWRRGLKKNNTKSHAQEKNTKM